jgi:hypothetical protein
MSQNNIGIFASQIPQGSYESIATVTVGIGGQASIAFTSIPATYKHLQIRGISRDVVSAVEGNVKMTFNSDTTAANYRMHSLIGNGSTASSQDLGNAVPIPLTITGNTATTNAYGAGIIDILDYTSTNKYKTARSLTGWDSNGDGRIMFRSTLWLSTSAITSITFTTNSGSNFARYSRYALYGIKG